MDPRSRNERVAGNPDDRDHEIAEDAAAMGAAGISRSTGTGGPGSGLAAGTDRGPARTTHAGTTGPATATGTGDLTDAAGPSAALQGGTGTAGSGVGTPSVAGRAPGGTGDDSTGTGTAGLSGAPGSAGDKGTTRGGSDAGGGGGVGGS